MRNLFFTLACACLLLSGAAARAQAPGVLYFEGYLEDADGAPVNDHLDVHVRLYDAQDAEGSIWDEAHPGVVATEGRFGVHLGRTNELSGQLFAAGPVWIGVTIGDDGELRPRQLVAGVPYALHAERAHDAAALQGMTIDDLAEAQHGHPELHVHDGAVWTDLNDGQGSGLDGDLLRGQSPEALLAEGTAQSLQAVADAGFVTGEQAVQAVAASGEFAQVDQPLTGSLDMGGHELRRPVIHNAEQAPAEPSAGQLWFDTSTQSLRLWSGEAWRPVPQDPEELIPLLVASDELRQLIVAQLVADHLDELRGPQGEPNPDAQLLDGFDTNASDQPVPHSIPVTDESGRIRAELLPFSKGDLLAPEDRQSVEGLATYGSDYFSVSGLGIDGAAAAQVRSGVAFGPDQALVGSLLPPAGTALPADVCNARSYVAGSWDPIVGTRTDCSPTSVGPGEDNVVSGVQYTVDGAAREGAATAICYETGPARAGEEGFFCADGSGDATATDLLRGRTAWVDGELVVGALSSMPDAAFATAECTIGPGGGECPVPVPAGTRQVDADVRITGRLHDIDTEWGRAAQIHALRASCPGGIAMFETFTEVRCNVQWVLLAGDLVVLRVSDDGTSATLSTETELSTRAAFTFFR